MKIRLNEIPQEGRQYDFDRKSGELNLALAELVGDHPYAVDFHIKPIGNAYEVRGKVATTVTEVCSSCGYDFEMPISRVINEILFEEQEDHRKAHSVHGNQSVDFLGEGPSMTAYRGNVFDAADFVHELIALAEPFYPLCGNNGECLRSEEAKAIRAKIDQEFALAEAEKKTVNPAFSVLKGLDLSKKN